MAEEQVTETAEAQAGSPAELEQLQAQLAELETQRAAYEAQVVALRGNLALAVGKYRARLLAEAPEVPEELVRGDTPEEVETSFAAASQVVERIRQQLETQISAERVPAGAPARGLPDLSALSPAEKIAYGLARR